MKSEFSEHIVVFKLAGMGDLLMVSPGLRALRKSFHDAKITFVVGRTCESVMANSRDVDEVIAIDDKKLFQGGGMTKAYSALRVLRLLRNLKADSIFILHRDWRWNLLARLSSIPNRYGFSRDFKGSFLTETVPSNIEEHEIYKYQRVFALKKGYIADGTDMHVYPTGEDDTVVDDEIREIRGKKIVAIAPGGASNVKEQRDVSRWPIERYRELIDSIQKDCDDLAIALVGGKGDKFSTEQLQGKGVYDYTGRLSVSQSYQFLKECDVLVTHDCGPMHLGAAACIPVVSIFGPTYPLEKRPITNENSTVLWKGEELECSPCYKDGTFPRCEHKSCMQLVSASDVYEAVRNVLGNSQWRENSGAER